MGVCYLLLEWPSSPDAPQGAHMGLSGTATAAAPALLWELLKSIRISFIFPTESRGIAEILRVDKNTW